MQTPPAPLRSGHIYMKDAHCAAPNEKSIFRFLFFELWPIVFTFYGDTPEISSVSPTKKKLFKSGQNFRKYAQWAETIEK